MRRILQRPTVARFFAITALGIQTAYQLTIFRDKHNRAIVGQAQHIV